MNVKVLYVSAKYRDPRGTWYIKKNIQIAEEIAVELWQMGFAVICPHSNTAFFEGPINDPIIIAGDCELVKRSDGVVVGPNWFTSEGTRIEWKTGFDNKKPIFFWEKPRDVEALKAWAKDAYDLKAHLDRQASLPTIEAMWAGVRLDEEKEEGSGPIGAGQARLRESCKCAL